MQKHQTSPVIMSRRSALSMSAGICAAALQGCGFLGRDTSGSAGSNETTAAPPTTSVEVKDPMVAQDATESPVTSEFARLLDEGSVHSIRLIGDSITAGFLCDGYGPTTDVLIYDGPYGAFYETAPEVICWANEFRSYAESRGVADFVNAGICGAKMLWLAEDSGAWIREGADVIFVMLGTNDAVYFTADEYRTNAEEGLSAIAGTCQHMVVLAPPDNAWTQYDPCMSQQEVEQVLQELCEAHGWTFLSLLDVIELGTDMVNEDQCHPTSKGSLALWDRVAQELGLSY